MSSVTIPHSWLCSTEALTLWRKARLEKLVVAQLFYTIPAFHATRIFITLLTRTHHWPMDKHLHLHAAPLHQPQTTSTCGAFQMRCLGIKRMFQTSRQNFIGRKGQIVLHIFSHQDLKCVISAIKVEMKRNTTVGDSEAKKPVETDGRMILNLILCFESENWIYLSNSQPLINDSFVESAVSVDLSDG
jgi:hypothetical protein